MPDCKYCQGDEVCVNADCPMCCDFCPVVDYPGVCRFEEREVTMDKIKNYLPDEEILAQLAEEAAEEEPAKSTWEQKYIEGLLWGAAAVLLLLLLIGVGVYIYQNFTGGGRYEKG